MGFQKDGATLQFRKGADPGVGIGATGVHRRQPDDPIVGKFNLDLALERTCLHRLLIMPLDADIAARKLDIVVVVIDQKSSIPFGDLEEPSRSHTTLAAVSQSHRSPAGHIALLPPFLD
ncbi:hypothetical protein [Mesorhizobium waimense]|uniref:hypothetical protein n=1 Tax=Mesorhizobium waimense TaxID=1300307 RepID=UPI001ABF2A7F|nr:hypothetical protein [Mesorhizobium waimense]